MKRDGVPKPHKAKGNPAKVASDLRNASSGRSINPSIARETKFFLATHKFKVRAEFDRALFEAMRKAPRGIRIWSRVYHENNREATFTWQARSQEVLKKFFGKIFKGRLMGGIVPVHFDPDPPMITSVFPFSVIKPNGAVILQGQNFGSFPGQLLLNGPEFPGGSLSLSSLQWGDSFASGVIPNVFGVRDQKATLQIVTSTGRKSNVVAVEFTAAREVRMLTGDVFHGKPSEGGLLFVGNATTEYTLKVLSSPDSNAFGNSGTDAFECLLKNGWVYFGFAWTDDTSGINGSPFGPLPEPVNRSDISLFISWFYNSFGSAQYGIRVFAIGPIGVPFK